MANGLNLVCTKPENVTLMTLFWFKESCSYCTGLYEPESTVTISGCSKSHSACLVALPGHEILQLHVVQYEMRSRDLSSFTYVLLHNVAERDWVAKLQKLDPFTCAGINLQESINYFYVSSLWATSSLPRKTNCKQEKSRKRKLTFMRHKIDYH